MGLSTGKPGPAAADGALRLKAAAWTGAALLLVSAIAYPRYAGSLGSYLLFDLAFVAMLLLALPRPLSYLYVFLASMLFLGFWSKLMTRLIFNTGFLEAIGSFSGSGAAWDQALLVSTMGAIGLIAARLAQLALASRYQPAAPAATPPPSWYVAWRGPVWIASVAAMLALYLLNLQLAFYQTGVYPKLVLPGRLNVLAGWLINIGFALWFALLIQWEFERAPRSLRASLLVPMVEGLVSSASALSRSFYLLHTLSYFVAAGAQWVKTRAALSRRTIACLVALWVLCFAVSLTSVSWLRIKIYFLAYEPVVVNIPVQEPVAAAEPATPTPGASMSNQVAPMVHEVSRLFLQRWIGLEAAMAVSSYPRIGPELFLEGVTQKPSRVEGDSLYQTIANYTYRTSDRFKFGTLPGIVGILFYSGSLAMVVAGVFAVTLLLMATELVAQRLTASPFLVSLVALGMANVVSQMNFAYLSAVFIAQLWVAIAFVWLLRAGARGRKQRRFETGARAG